ncbi:MAG: putative metallopeptidase [Candidatus Aenigmatarchaeota archaeon]
MIKYFYAHDITKRMEEIVRKLNMKHVDTSRLVCVRSKGSGSKRTIARCHALPRIMQFALGTNAYYIVEILAERFDGLSEEEQTKTLIHEVMHIPKSFGGGFKFHNVVTRRNVEEMYRRFVNA